ncbi:MAG TPA: peroxidase-related enzyme, partial [Kofleriaceae bacterium]|nr:peroxidase-related enzyme [Kofleriaceae bacterium]
MPFIRTIPPHEATGTVAELYEQDRQSTGFVPNHTRSLSLRPEAVKAFRALTKAIKANMDPRRFELATLAAARALRSSYCMLSHSTFLKRMNAHDEKELTAIAKDYRSAGLSDADVAVMAFAEQLTVDACEIKQSHIDDLRAHGLSDEEILDVGLTAALRNFYSKLLDAVGAQADPAYHE